MYTEDKEVLRALEESDKKANALRDELNKLEWRGEPSDPEYSGYFEQELIRSLLTDDPEEDIEYIGGIDAEDEEGNSIDVDKELDTFFDYKKERGVFSSESYLKVHLVSTNETFVIINTTEPGGGDTRIYRIKT